jgi:hypothetical protein
MKIPGAAFLESAVLHGAQPNASAIAQPVFVFPVAAGAFQGELMGGAPGTAQGAAKLQPFRAMRPDAAALLLGPDADGAVGDLVGHGFRQGVVQKPGFRERSRVESKSDRRGATPAGELAASGGKTFEVHPDPALGKAATKPVSGPCPQLVNPLPDRLDGREGCVMSSRAFPVTTHGPILDERVVFRASQWYGRILICDAFVRSAKSMPVSFGAGLAGPYS